MLHFLISDQGVLKKMLIFNVISVRPVIPICVIFMLSSLRVYCLLHILLFCSLIMLIQRGTSNIQIVCVFVWVPGWFRFTVKSGRWHCDRVSVFWRCFHISNSVHYVTIFHVSQPHMSLSIYLIENSNIEQRFPKTDKCRQARIREDDICQ